MRCDSCGVSALERHAVGWIRFRCGPYRGVTIERLRDGLPPLALRGVAEFCGLDCLRDALAEMAFE